MYKLVIDESLANILIQDQKLSFSNYLRKLMWQEMEIDKFVPAGEVVIYESGEFDKGHLGYDFIKLLLKEDYQNRIRNNIINLQNHLTSVGFSINPNDYRNEAIRQYQELLFESCKKEDL